jgi:hypothetical protein
MKIYCVRIGDKYGPEYETYIQDKLKDYDLHFIREQYDPRVILQWNKMYPMSLDTTEPVCVIDIDLLLVNDYKEMFDYPIKRGQFLALSSWWHEDLDVNGGFFKYYPKDCNYIYDKFMSDPIKWQRHYIDNGMTTGPVNGEQNFVKESVEERLELVRTPEKWATRWMSEDGLKYLTNTDYDTWVLGHTSNYKEATGNNWVYLGGAWHPDIKIVHFTNHINKPHEWSGYSENT